MATPQGEQSFSKWRGRIVLFLEHFGADGAPAKARHDGVFLFLTFSAFCSGQSIIHHHPTIPLQHL